MDLVKEDKEKKKEGYWGYFNRASDIYATSDGPNRLLCAINSGELRDGLDGMKFEIAQTTMLDFLRGINTTGSNRLFGIRLYEKGRLVKIAEEKELNISPQSA
jgi:hypothetical protein